jgi:hypothetical protein
MGDCTANVRFRGKADKYERCGISPLHVGTVTGSSRATVAATALFRLARINLDSTTPAMMAPAITRIVVRSMFIDYPSSR